MIPFPVFDLYQAALFPALALERLNTAQAIGLAIATGHPAKEAWEADRRELYRGEG